MWRRILDRGLHAGCFVLHMTISGACIGIQIYFLMPEGEMCFFCSETLVSSRRHISELIIPGFGRPMQPFGSKINRFRGLAVYVRDGFSAYRQ